MQYVLQPLRQDGARNQRWLLLLLLLLRVGDCLHVGSLANEFNAGQAIMAACSSLAAGCGYSS
jgi:hypothetical protein